MSFWSVVNELVELYGADESVLAARITASLKNGLTVISKCEAVQRYVPRMLSRQIEELQSKVLRVMALTSIPSKERRDVALELFSRLPEARRTGSTFHDLVIDAVLGLPTEMLMSGVEKVCYLEAAHRYDDYNIFAGTTASNLLSSYALFKTVIDSLRPRPGSKVVDLGSGYGRMGFYVGLAESDLNFRGYEIFEPRLRASHEVAHKLGLNSRVEFIEADLNVYDLTADPGDFYFMFNPVRLDTLEVIFEQLQMIASMKRIGVVVTRNTFLPPAAYEEMIDVTPHDGWPFRVFEYESSRAVKFNGQTHAFLGD